MDDTKRLIMVMGLVHPINAHHLHLLPLPKQRHPPLTNSKKRHPSKHNNNSNHLRALQVTSLYPQQVNNNDHIVCIYILFILIMDNTIGGKKAKATNESTDTSTAATTASPSTTAPPATVPSPTPSHASSATSTANNNASKPPSVDSWPPALQ